MATVPVSITTVINEKIQKNSDCFQVTFTIAPDLTPVWRTVIKRRALTVSTSPSIFTQRGLTTPESMAKEF